MLRRRQHGLGLAALGLGCVILWVLKGVEGRLPRERQATLTLTLGQGGPSDQELREILQASGCKITAWDARYTRKGNRQCRKVRFEVHRPGTSCTEPAVPELVRQLVEKEGVQGVRWQS